MGDVTTLREHYPENTIDEKWIPEVARNGWVLISGDRRQARKPEERAILKESGVIAFYLAKGFNDLTLSEKASKLAAVWPKITRQASKTIGGQCYLVHLHGKIDVLILRSPTRRQAAQ